VKLRLSDDLSLPIDAVTQKLAFLARSGAGKTYAAGKLVEELVAAKQQVVVVDPVGVWWGLRLAADGKKPGIPIYVFGGQHQDVPLEPTGGKLVAELIVKHGMSVVLDVSPLTGGEQRRFVTDFAVTLLQEKKRHRSPLMVVWEECQDFVPQRVMGPSAQMAGAMERLIKQGRNFGIGTTLISQRPQAVNKDVLNQTECLIVMQMTGPQERKTIQGWVVENAADVAGAVDQLPSLHRGEAFVWSPQWLRIFQKVRIGKKWTFDASSTPEFGKRQVARELAPVDLAAVSAAMKDTIERAKAEDPRELRKKIATLEAQVRKAEAAKPSIRVEKTEVPVIRAADLKRLQKFADGFREDVNRIAPTIAALLEGAKVTARIGVMPIDEARKRLALPPNKKPITMPLLSGGNGKDHGVLTGPERKLLTALAQHGPTVSVRRLAILTGYSQQGGGFRNPLSALRSKGYLEGREDVAITPAGQGALGAWDPLPAGRDLMDYWLQRLPGPEKKILVAIASVHPQAIAVETVAEMAGYEADGGGFRNPLSRLRTLELVSGRGELRASEELFS
jgi:hypothetical protein